MKAALDVSWPAQCEAILKAGLAYNRERGILASENIVIDRLLKRSLELQTAYSELGEKLGKFPRGVNEFLSVLLSTAAFWCPEKNAEAREERKRLADVNCQIAETGHQLADLLAERSHLNNHSGFSSGEIYDLHSAIEAAGEDHYMYQSYVRSQLQPLFGQYDLKYWPSIRDIVEAIAEDGESAEIYATDPLTDAGTQGARASRADFFKSWFASLEENTIVNHGLIPGHVRLSDESLAVLASCALDLDGDDLVDGAYVKRLRQRLREVSSRA